MHSLADHLVDVVPNRYYKAIIFMKYRKRNRTEAVYFSIARIRTLDVMCLPLTQAFVELNDKTRYLGYPLLYAVINTRLKRTRLSYLIATRAPCKYLDPFVKDWQAHRESISALRTRERCSRKSALKPVRPDRVHLSGDVSWKWLGVWWNRQRNC
jgi:hypothetical protein